MATWCSMLMIQPQVIPGLHEGKIMNFTAVKGLAEKQLTGLSLDTNVPVHLFWV